MHCAPLPSFPDTRAPYKVRYRSRLSWINLSVIGPRHAAQPNLLSFSPSRVLLGYVVTPTRTYATVPIYQGKLVDPSVLSQGFQAGRRKGAGGHSLLTGLLREQLHGLSRGASPGRGVGRPTPPARCNGMAAHTPLLAIQLSDLKLRDTLPCQMLTGAKAVTIHATMVRIWESLYRLWHAWPGGHQ